MTSTRTIRHLAKQAITWSAMFTLLVQPVSLQASDCGCCSKGHSQNETQNCCSTTTAANSCCSQQSSTCCSARTNPCSVEKTQSSSPCKCNDKCQCSVQNEPTVPIPAIPTNNSGHDQTQLVLLAIQPICCSNCFAVAKPKPRPDSTIARTLTAQQVCALLSRFTC